MESANPSDLREGWKWKSFFFGWDFCGGKKKIATDSPTRAAVMLWRGTRPRNSKFFIQSKI
jgi:hypothetical protein